MITLQGITKRFGETAAIENLSLTIAAGEFCSLVGPSGCGKSTVLRMINAMIVPDAGKILVRDKDISQSAPVELRRSIGYVIQSVGLFPHWTIADNILAVPRLLNWPKARRLARLEEIVALLGIDPPLLARYPRHLSGGQQQRVGVARALAADPDIVLMDEPFAALDPLSRVALQTEMRRIHAASGKTFVFVTHDMDEALHLATRINVLRRGQLVQSGTPAEILLSPAEDFVRDFIGGPDAAYRILDVLTVATRMRRAATPPDGPSIAASASLKEALSLMLTQRCNMLRVDNDADGGSANSISVSDIIGPG